MSARPSSTLLVAAAGSGPCTLIGSPTRITFRDPRGAALAVVVTTESGERSPVVFGPGHDVHFDVQVPNEPGGASAIAFVLRTPDGTVAGEQEASGSLTVASGTQVGPVRAG